MKFIEKLSITELLDWPAMVQKADVCVEVAKLIFPNASEEAIEDRALEFMSLRDSDLASFWKALLVQKAEADVARSLENHYRQRNGRG